MRATDSLSIRGLVGLAKAEAKRWGSDHATVTHAASAFAQNWTGEFRDAFGSDGEALLHRLLAAGQTIGNEAEVRNMIGIAGCRGPGNAVAGGPAGRPRGSRPVA